MWRTNSRRAGALTTFSQGFFRHLVLQHGLDQQPLETGVFKLELLEPFRVRDAHAAELVTPEVVAGLRETMPVAQLCHWQSRFRFLQEANDLFFCKSLFHVQSPVFGIGLQSQTLLRSGGGGVACASAQARVADLLASRKFGGDQ